MATVEERVKAVTAQVLMLAYSSRESLRQTFERDKVWYYSRSREKLWLKGEISGNFQYFQKIRTDCDGDALLVTVDQKGYACHTGNYSCFGNKAFSLKELYDIIKERLANPSSVSYTATLTDEMLQKKIIEEAHELIEARNNKEIIYNYFCLSCKHGENNYCQRKQLNRRKNSIK